MSSHRSGHRSSYSEGYPRRSGESGRSGYYSSARYGQPVAYTTTTRRSSSTDRQARHSPSNYYTVSDSGRVTRGRSLERPQTAYVPASGAYQGYGYAATPSNVAYSHSQRPRRASSHSRYSPPRGTVYAAPAPTRRSGSRDSHTRGRSHSRSSFIDARHSTYPRVRVIPDSQPDRAHRRARSVSVDRHGHEHISFADRVRRLFGLGPAEEHANRRNVYYADPHSGREATSSGKAFRSRRMEYMDSRTGREVDSRGRPIYTV
jgi:hypothetical protein